MKLKTIKEYGKLTEAEITTYDKVREIRNKRNLRDFAIKNYDTPIFMFVFFLSSALSTLLSIWILLEVNSKLNLVYVIPFDSVWLLIGFLFAINMLAILIFLMGMTFLAINNAYAKKETEYKKELYKKD